MTEKKSIKSGYDAVSPVVGVMLMLVVTIIIAAVVSAFSGGLMSEQKIPQATIQGDFSISDGLKITHIGGDPLPMHELVFTIWDGPTFGPNVETVTKQVLDMSLLSDTDGTPVMGESGSYNVTSFNAGDRLIIEAKNCEPDLMQPVIVPEDYTTYRGLDYIDNGGSYPNRWALCLKNTDSIGKEFVLAISDTAGNMIAKTDVTVTS